MKMKSVLNELAIKSSRVLSACALYNFCNKVNMKEFCSCARSYARLLTLALPLVLTSSMAKNSYAQDKAILGTAMSGVGTMGLMIGLASMDAGSSIGDCFCLASTPPKTCPKTPVGVCATLALSIASILAGIAMQASSQKTADSVRGAEQALDLSNWSNVMHEFCNEQTKNTYVCDPNGIETMKKDLAMVDTMNKNGLLSTGDSAKITGDIERAQRMISNMESGNYNAVLAEGGGTPLDEDSAGRGRAGLVRGGGFPSGADDSSKFGNGASANYSGMIGLTAISGDGAVGKVGPINAKLGKVEWNGGLDMVDSETGKSLTLWERATRRYMGSPDGKRGFTLARIEFVRKQSIPKAAEAPKIPEGEKVAKKEYEPMEPVQISTSQIIGR
jgi:hypothetical protein